MSKSYLQERVDICLNGDVQLGHFVCWMALPNSQFKPHYCGLSSIFLLFIDKILSSFLFCLNFEFDVGVEDNIT